MLAILSGNKTVIIQLKRSLISVENLIHGIHGEYTLLSSSSFFRTGLKSENSIQFNSIQFIKAHFSRR